MALPQELFFDPPPLYVLARDVKTSVRKTRDGDQYRLACQLPYGKFEGAVDAVVFQHAESVRDQAVVLLHVKPRQEQVRGEFNKGGYWFQFDVVDVSEVPVGFGKVNARSVSPSAASTKP